LLDRAETKLRQRWPFFWISRVNSLYAQTLDKRLKRIGLDMPRWRVLISLYEEDYLSVSQIAELGALRLNTTTKIVQRLSAEGLVETRIKPDDARVTEVRMTEKGDEVRALCQVEADAVLKLGFQNVSEAERQFLNTILEKVFQQLERL